MKIKLIALVLSMVMLGQSLQAQQINIAGLMGMEADGADLETSMRIEIDAIQRITGINDNAAKKLEVAAKAAIKNAIKNANPPKIGLVPLGHAAPDPDSTALSDEVAEHKQKENNNGDAVANPGLPLNGSSAIEGIKKEEIWLKTLSKVLTQDQANQYKTFQESRSKRERATLVQNYVCQMDDYLLFSDSQRDAVTALVDRDLGEDLVQNKQMRGGIGGGANVIIQVVGVQAKEPSIDGLKEILTPIQLAEYRRRRDHSAMLPFQKREANKKETHADVMGMSVQESNSRLAIVEISPDSAAEKAGLRVGDVIDSINDNPIDTMLDFKRAAGKMETKWSMQVIRDGQTVQVGADKP